MKSIRYLMLIPLFALAVNAHAAKPIQDMVNVAVPVRMDGSPMRLDQVELAIIAGCKTKGWRPVKTGDNKFTASIWVRSKHFAEVEIPYSQTHYSILYKRSDNLDYNAKKRTIHRNYNKWVILLSEAIQKDFDFY